jgi:hypothetical protein
MKKRAACAQRNYAASDLKLAIVPSRLGHVDAASDVVRPAYQHVGSNRADEKAVSVDAIVGCHHPSRVGKRCALAFEPYRRRVVGAAPIRQQDEQP